MLDKIKKYKKWFFSVLVVIIIILCLLHDYRTLKEDKNPSECCEIACSKLGPTVTCVSAYDDIIKCGFSYEKYGLPELEEVFEFRVINDSICFPEEIVVKVINNSIVFLEEIEVKNGTREEE